MSSGGSPSRKRSRNNNAWGPNATAEGVVNYFRSNARLNELAKTMTKANNAAIKAKQAQKSQYNVHKVMGKYQALAYNKLARKYGWATHANILRRGP
jgi:hypothetical protein